MYSLYNEGIEGLNDNAKESIMQLRNIGSNQTEVSNDNARILFSYSTPVAAYVYGEGYYRTEQFYSVTTSRHINKWMGQGGEEKPQSYFNSLA